jgi:hypothetical protein
MSTWGHEWGLLKSNKSWMQHTACVAHTSFMRGWMDLREKTVCDDYFHTLHIV